MGSVITDPVGSDRIFGPKECKPCVGPGTRFPHPHPARGSSVRAEVVGGKQRSWPDGEVGEVQKLVHQKKGRVFWGRTPTGVEKTRTPVSSLKDSFRQTANLFLNRAKRSGGKTSSRKRPRLTNLVIRTGDHRWTSSSPSTGASELFAPSFIAIPIGL